MAITATSLDSGASTNADPSVTANNITPTANATVLVGILVGAARTVAGVTGCGITWTQVDTDAVNLNNWYVFRGSNAAPSTGKLSFDLNLASTTNYIVVEATGNSNATTDGVVQSAKGTGTTSATATLSAFASSANGVVAFASTYDLSGSPSLAPGSGYTELADETDGGQYRISAEWRADNDTSVDVTATGGDDSGIIAMEIAAATATFVPRIISY